MRISPVLVQAKINIEFIQPYALPTKEQWALSPPKIILDLHKNKKVEVDLSFFKSEFLEIRSKYKHRTSIYTDGSKQDGKILVLLFFQNF